MHQIHVVQNIQLIILLVLLAAAVFQIVRVYVKFKVQRKVYGKGRQGIDKFIESEVIKEETKLNKAKTNQNKAN